MEITSVAQYLYQLGCCYELGKRHANGSCWAHQIDVFWTGQLHPFIRDVNQKKDLRN